MQPLFAELIEFDFSGEVCSHDVLDFFRNWRLVGVAVDPGECVYFL